VAVIGVDVGGTKVAAGLTLSVPAAAGAPLPGCPAPAAVTRAPTPPVQAHLIETIVGVVTELAGRSPEPVEALGVGVPSLIDRASGRALMSVNADLADLAVGSLLEARLGLPTAVDNDGNLSVLVEHRAGAARGRPNVVMVTLGTGIGGGVVLDGAVFRGGRGTGAELGHVTVEFDGPPCNGNCPNRGCLETMVSGTAIARDARARAEARPDGALARAARGGTLDALLVAELARAGDPDALEVLERSGRYLGAGLAALANIFNPDVLVVGGGLSDVGELLLAPAREEFGLRALWPNADAPVLAAAFGAEAGMLGATLAARDLLAARSRG
jgi:glucokinase